MMHCIFALLALTACGTISAQSPDAMQTSTTSAPSTSDIVRRLQFKATDPETTDPHINSKLTTSTTTTEAPQRTCSWFGSACKAYSDGCNYCWCNEDGSSSDCSQRTCVPS